MAKHAGPKTPSETSHRDAMQIALGIQRPGQTKEQTRLIANGIQQGIDQYKRQQKARVRELERERKKRQREPEPATAPTQAPPPEPGSDPAAPRRQWLPWLLLVATWAGIAAYALGGRG